MKLVVATSAFTARLLRHPVFVFVAAAILLGVALYPRGPDTHFAPVMAEQPVTMPSGAKLLVQKYEVSVSEWDACHAAGACALSMAKYARDSGPVLPATGLSYVDVSEYLNWINGVTGQHFRLPTVLEWEHMAAEVLPDTPDPIFTDPALTWASAYLIEPQIKRTLRPQGAFDTTAEGIVDLNGNVWEWTQDCYTGAAGGDIPIDRCPAFFVGGEHVAAMSFLVRDPARGGCAVGSPPAHLGMRLVLDHAT